MDNTTGRNTGFEIEYLANCALLIRTQGKSMLIDAPYENTSDFENIDEQTEHMILTGQVPYGVDAALFTHFHSDHFDREKVKKMHVNRTSQVQSEALGGRHPLVVLTPAEFDRSHAPLQIGPYKISFYKSGHISTGEQDHYCILIDDGRRQVLITGDMDLTKIRDMKERLGFPHPHCIGFFNPIVLGKPSFIADMLSLELDDIYIYHLPPKSKDHFGYRKMGIAQHKKYVEQIPNLQLLLHPGEKLSL